MYIVISLFPLLIYLIGLVCKKYHSTYPDIVIGYRTSFAIKNRETWKEANNHIAKSTQKGALATIGMNLILWVLQTPLSSSIILLNIIVPFCFAFYTEIHLRNMFDQNGNRKKDV